MNIFDIYLNKIKNIVSNNSANLKIPQNLSGINVDTAPAKFKADISTNVCMILSSLNKLAPTEIYKQLNLEDLKNDKDIENIEFVKPGFVNINVGAVNSSTPSSDEKATLPFIRNNGLAVLCITVKHR